MYRPKIHNLRSPPLYCGEEQAASTFGLPTHTHWNQSEENMHTIWKKIAKLDFIKNALYI